MLTGVEMFSFPTDLRRCHKILVCDKTGHLTLASVSYEVLSTQKDRTP